MSCVATCPVPPMTPVWLRNRRRRGASGRLSDPCIVRTDQLPLPSGGSGEGRTSGATASAAVVEPDHNKVIEVVNAGSRYEARAGPFTVGLALTATLAGAWWRCG